MFRPKLLPIARSALTNSSQDAAAELTEDDEKDEQVEESRLIEEEIIRKMNEADDQCSEKPALNSSPWRFLVPEVGGSLQEH